MSIKYRLILYEDSDHKRFVGSGFLVNSKAVLTADHIATGRNLRVVFDGQEVPIERSLRSGRDEIDIAVLVLKDPVADIEQSYYAQVDRSGGITVNDVWAVGFPRLSKDDKGRASLQIDGYIRPADDVHALAFDGPDSEWLTLIGTSERWETYTPDDLEAAESSPWGGMSGAAVLKGRMVVGVIRSHNAAKGSRALTVTPLTALKRLPDKTRRQFCELLGLKDLDNLPTLGRDEPARPRNSPVAEQGLGFSAEVRERYRSRLAAAGLKVPGLWDIAELSELRSGHQGEGDAADLLDALCLALSALPVLHQVGGRQVAIERLRHLYRHHVGSWPYSACVEGMPILAASVEEMLILAASASMAEKKRAETDAGYQAEPVTALARFMLAVAAYWQAASLKSGVSAPGAMPVIDWLTDRRMQQQEDLTDYLDSKVGGRSWALIELKAEDASQRTRPSAITVYLVGETGRFSTDCIQVTSSPQETDPTDGVREALRKAISGLPEDGVFIDLCLPRHWLGAGLEYWDVVPVGDQYESISQHYSPRLRWAMHRHDRYLRRRLEERFKAVDWLARPVSIPSSITGDQLSLQNWLDRRDLAGLRHPPYLTGASNADGADDPLGTLLRQGYGLAVWFGAVEADDICAQAANVARRMGAAERRNDLPDKLATKLRKHKPAIIWSDPEGRAGFPLPSSRGGGTLRGGAR